MVPANSTVIYHDVCSDSINRSTKRRNPRKLGQKPKPRTRESTRTAKRLWIGHIPQAQRATAFHFLISNLFGFFEVEEDGAADGPTAPLEPSPAGTILMSVSREAMDRRKENYEGRVWRRHRRRALLSHLRFKYPTRGLLYCNVLMLSPQPSYGVGPTWLCYVIV